MAGEDEEALEEVEDVAEPVEVDEDSVVDFVSDFDSLFGVSDEEDEDDDEPFEDADDDDRESVMYHPLPLNTMPTG